MKPLLISYAIGALILAPGLMVLFDIDLARAFLATALTGVLFSSVHYAWIAHRRTSDLSRQNEILEEALKQALTRGLLGGD